MDDPNRLSFQAALMAVSVWVLGGLLLEVGFGVVGLGGIVVLLVTLVVARRVAPLFDDEG